MWLCHMKYQDLCMVKIVNYTLFLVLSAGVAVRTHKPHPPPTLVAPLATPPTINNNIKKFAFLSHETVPDYRPRDNVSS